MNLKKYKVFSNTTPLIALASIGKLELLPRFFNEVTIAEAVKDELNAGGEVDVPSPDTIEWIKIKKNIIDIKEKLLFDLDEGEKQSILITIDSEEKGECENLLLIDERKGRKIATSLGVKIKGTLGVLAEAKRRGLIDNFKNYALKLLENNLYYDLKLIDAISQEVDE